MHAGLGMAFAGVCLFVCFSHTRICQALACVQATDLSSASVRAGLPPTERTRACLCYDTQALTPFTLCRSDARKCHACVADAVPSCLGRRYERLAAGAPATPRCAAAATCKTISGFSKNRLRPSPRHTAPHTSPVAAVHHPRGAQAYKAISTAGRTAGRHCPARALQESC